MEQQREAKSKISLLIRSTDLLRTLLTELDTTKQKWLDLRNKLRHKRRTQEGDTMLFAVMAGFGGVLSRERRDSLLRDCMSALASADIAYNGT